MLSAMGYDNFLALGIPLEVQPPSFRVSILEADLKVFRHENKFFRYS
jgi:hypothetical protein